MRRFLLNFLKLVVSVGLLAYLLVEVQRSDPATFTRLQQASPRWPTLFAGLGLLLAALAVGVVRWRLVLHAFGISSPLAMTFRCAIRGFALDFVALGTAGGDFVKGMLLAHDQTGRSALVLMTVLVDRVIGLHLLLTLSGFILLVRNPLGPDLYPLRASLIAAALGINLLPAVLWIAPGMGSVIERRSRALGHYGQTLASLIVALRRIRDQPYSIAPAMLVNLAALGLLVSGCFLVAISLPGEMPTFAEQWQIVPIAMLSGILPLPGGTLGALDYAMSAMYQHVTAGRVPLGQGLLVVMVSRTINFVVVSLAVVSYVNPGARRKPAPPRAAP